MYAQEKDNILILLSLIKLMVKFEMIDLPTPFENTSLSLY